MRPHNPWLPPPFWNLTEQFRLLRNDPAQAATFQIEAGVTPSDDGEEAIRQDLADEEAANRKLRSIALNEAIRNHPGASSEATVHDASVFFNFLKDGTDQMVTSGGSLPASGTITLGETDAPPAAPALPVDPAETSPEPADVVDPPAAPGEPEKGDTSLPPDQVIVTTPIATPIATDLTLSNAQTAPVPNGAA